MRAIGWCFGVLLLGGCGDKDGASDSDTATGSGSTSAGMPTGGPGPDTVLRENCDFNDGRSVDIRIAVEAAVCGATWSGEKLQVVLFQAAPLAVGEHVVDVDSGFASLQIGDDSMMAIAGTVTITEWTGDAVSGSYALTFPDAVTRAGDFVGFACSEADAC